MVRYHGQRPSLFWGLRQLSRAEAAQIVAGARAVLFVGGHLRGRYAAAVDEALERYPFVPSAKAVQARLLDPSNILWDPCLLGLLELLPHSAA